jgi:hypothetical protein
MKKRTNLREVYFYKMSFSSSKRLILNNKSNHLENLNNVSVENFKRLCLIFC